jgi:hypothetical protein
LGNVREWCLDAQREYDTAQHDDPRGPLGGGNRAGGVGSWMTIPGACRSTCRPHGKPTERSADGGFRVVCEPSATTRDTLTVRYEQTKEEGISAIKAHFGIRLAHARPAPDPAKMKSLLACRVSGRGQKKADVVEGP